MIIIDQNEFSSRYLKNSSQKTPYKSGAKLKNFKK